MNNDCMFDLTEKVYIDGDKSIVAVVIGIMFETSGCSVRISWVSDGKIEREWIEEWRLSKWEE